MSFSISAKTFLLGEYAALQGYPAILLNTTPCFELSITDELTLEGIHPHSPAGQFWKRFGPQDKGLRFYDPYQGLGGLGASSAQFLGAYQAYLACQNQRLDFRSLLEMYELFTWNGQGIKPSGYDVLAQLYNSCVYVSRHPLAVSSLDWSFEHLSVVLLHTGVKCVTHTHLHQLETLPDLQALGHLVHMAKDAIENKQASILIHCINAYEELLQTFGWVMPSTRQWLDKLKSYPGVLAAKGCGAMGSDVMLFLVKKDTLSGFLERAQDLRVLAIY
jgi:mevalonate kinase